MFDRWWPWVALLFCIGALILFMESRSIEPNDLEGQNPAAVSQ